MKKGLLKKIILTTAGTFVLLFAILCVHIYFVMRPKAPDAHTIVMARVDLHQPINEADAGKITEWLYQQNGISHVLCNAKTDIVIFTFLPVKTTGDEIVKNLKANFNFDKAIRYVPSEEELKSGCPVASNSFTMKAYKLMTQIF